MRSAGAGQKRGLRASLAGNPIPFAGTPAFNPASVVDAGNNSLLVQNGFQPSASKFLSNVGTGTRRDGQQGRCYLYDGTDDYSILDAGFTASGDFTLSFNINVTSFAAAFHVFYQSTNDRIYFNSGTSFNIIANGTLSGFTLDKTLVAGTWYNILVRRVSGTITVYVDGVAQSDTEANAEDLDFLQFSSSPGTLNAKLFDVRYFNSAITDAQLTYVVSQGRIGDAVTPTNWWKCDEQAGTIGYDSVGGNHLTHTNITASTFHATQTLYSFQNEVGYSKAYQTAQQVFTAKQAVNITGLSFKFRSTDTALVVFNNGVSTPFLLLAQSGNISTGIYLNSGTPTISIDGSTGWGTTRDDLYTALCDGNVHTVEITSLSFSAGFGSDGIYVNSYPTFPWDSSTFLWDLVATGTGNLTPIESTIFVPRDESDTTKDIAGGTLQYTGKRPNDGALINSNCVTLNGTNQAVRVADNTDLDITDNLTVSVWAKNDNALLSTFATMVGKYDAGSNKREFFLGLDSSEKIYVAIGTAGGTSASSETSSDAIDPTGLHHYVATFKSGTVKLYMNGVLMPSTKSGAHVTTLNNEDADLTIGSVLSSGAPVYLWDGQILDARIYAGDSTVLTDAEILSIYENPEANINFTGQTLKAHYKLAEGSGTTCFDASGNGNDGTIENAGSNWGTLQDNVHMNINTGFSLYEHASSDPVRVPYDLSGSAITITPPSGYTKTSDNPRVNGHNDAESDINFNPDSVPVNANIIQASDGDGSSYISIPDNALFDITNYLSVSCWAKNDAALLSVGEYMMAKYNTTSNLREWTMLVDVDEKLAVNLGDPADGTFEGNFVSNDTVTLNQWNHFGFTFDSGTVKLYLNGVEVAGSTIVGSVPATLHNSTSPFSIFSGFAGGSASSFWNGAIQHCRIYKGDSTVLTDAQMAQVYAAPEKLLTFSGQTLVCAHELMSDTLDYSGNNLHGANNGITFTKYTVPTAYSFGDTLTGTYNHFKREVSSVKEDRFLLYRESLELNSKLSAVEAYTT